MNVPDVTVPTVVILPEPAQVDKAVFSTLPNPTSDCVTVSQAGAALVVPLPVCLRNFLVVVILPASLLRILVAELYKVSPNA